MALNFNPRLYIHKHGQKWSEYYNKLRLIKPIPQLMHCGMSVSEQWDAGDRHTSTINQVGQDACKIIGSELLVDIYCDATTT